VRPWIAGAGLLVVGIAVGFAAGVRVGAWRPPEPRSSVPVLLPVRPSPPRDRDAPPELRAPLRGPALVNVWLQGCADCMPKFEAWSRHAAARRLPRGLAVHNVAYGDATREFAARYRVDQGLSSDRGGVYVKPLGIGTFTTLLVDAEGRVLDRLDPTAEGFVTRISLFAEEQR
jgi:hypothetical protein